MRKLVAVVTVTTVALGAAAAALADFTQTANVTLTAHKAGQSSGIKSSLTSSDPTAPGGKPKATTSVTVTFPTGTKFNLSSVTACTLSDTQLQATAGPTCPATSKIGSGSAVANASPLASSVTATVTAYASGAKSMVMVVNHASVPGAPTIVLHATVSGSKLTIPVAVPPLAGISIVLTSLNLTVPAHGSGKTALITAGKCVAHKFTVKTHFAYADGSTLDLSDSSHCS